MAERAWAAIAVAFAFLTIVPTGLRARQASEDDVRAARFAFPLVGVVLGVVLALLSGVLHRAGVAPGVAAFVLIATLAALTGGLHLDGLADTADGLFLPGGPARRLEVMRDPHIGSFGVTGVILCLLGKQAALAAMSASVRGVAVLVALAVSRSLILVAAGRSRYARPEGTGRLIVDATSPQEAFASGALVLLAASLALHLPGLCASLVALGIACGLTALANRRIGGVTGDILGAITELSELGCLVILGCFA